MECPAPGSAAHLPFFAETLRWAVALTWRWPKLLNIGCISCECPDENTDFDCSIHGRYCTPLSGNNLGKGAPYKSLPMWLETDLFTGEFQVARVDNST
ncbi:hypothetical protein RRG08_056994 [Elysia crispata]|uniref:Uncharacterized protein n=1 Tax=Elysia crispata TaxID=231223 RepID=A0AAE0Z6J1_9GAST|nr:hypothetical protein RRG08_056994 [Elysia crispata]